MKKPNNHYPILLALVLSGVGLIPASFGGEKKLVPARVKIQTSLEDPVLARLHRELITPLKRQEDRLASFSRRKVTKSTSYHLVENKVGKKAGERQFSVMRTSTLFIQGEGAKASEYLKVRYLEGSGGILVGAKGKWVSIAEHPVLGKLPKEQEKAAS